MTEAELKIVHLLCEPGKTSVDVGAYEGEYTKEMSKYSRQVYAFEPMPRRYDALKRKRFVKGKNVFLYKTALSDSSGLRKLHTPIFKSRFHKDYVLDAMASIENSHDYFEDCPGYQGERMLEIETMTLDSFHINDLAFMKIDVEGHEFSVLRGAEKTIERCRPHLLIEIEERHHGDHETINKWMINKGYLGFFVYNNELRTFSDFDVESMQHQPLNKIKHRPKPYIPDYVNNFMFFHESKSVSDKIIEFLIKNN